MDDLDIGCCLDGSGGNSASALLFETKLNWLIGVNLDADIFNVEHDVDDIFFNTFNGCNLVTRTFYTESDNRTTANAREQNATEAVAKGKAVVGVKRLDNELSFVDAKFVDCG